MEKYDEAIGTHRAKIEHWKREMSKIKLHATDDNQTPELNVLSEEELAEARVETYQNLITKAEAELGRITPNLQVSISFNVAFMNILKLNVLFISSRQSQSSARKRSYIYPVLRNWMK